jgi:hypothetical protein
MHVVVAMVEEQEFEIDEDKYCLQGLEFQSERGTTLLMWNKLESMNAILDKQDWQPQRVCLTLRSFLWYISE